MFKMFKRHITLVKDLIITYLVFIFFISLSTYYISQEISLLDCIAMTATVTWITLFIPAVICFGYISGEMFKMMLMPHERTVKDEQFLIFCSCLCFFTVVSAWFSIIYYHIPLK